MSTARSDTKAATLLVLLIAIGLALLTIPWFLTPPAFLELALRDAVFGADLSKQVIQITDDATGKSLQASVSKSGNSFIAHIGRINSGKGTYTARLTGYKPGVARITAGALERVRVPIELRPTFGRVELSTVNATLNDTAIAATVKTGPQTLSQDSPRVLVFDLPPGKHRFTADANGFCPSEREFIVVEGKVTKGVFPLSPDLTNEELARFVLGWRNEPRDLDAHFMKSNAFGIPNPGHLFWRQKTAWFANGDVFARLDVDELYPGRYETVTVRANAVGDFRYLVHRFQGFGTINDAEPIVQVYTKGCQMRTFTPPPACADDVWIVANLQYSHGNLQLNEIRTCEPATGPGVIK
ncbi:MAG: hypothetical protein ACTHQM_16495 [Thermoanaerobaculia bacterium]